MKKIANSLHLGVSSTQRLLKKHFLDPKLSIGGRPLNLMDKVEMFCVRNLNWGGMSIGRKGIKQLQEEFGVKVSEKIVHHGLNRQDLHVQIK